MHFQTSDNYVIILVMYEKIKSQIKNFPNHSGVYLMKDCKGAILYVGKAGDLKKRVFSYFNKTRDRKTLFLVKRIDRVEYILTRNEFEALILENSLIKQHSPKYNINLKDGKSYPVIRITSEEFPRIFRTRTVVRDGSLYFGPYTHAKRLDFYLNLVEKLYPLRRCRGPLKKRDTPCLYYHINRCAAPCVGKISAGQYNERVKEIVRLLKGKVSDIVSDMKQKMKAHASDLAFEKAAEIRDLLSVVESMSENKEVVDQDSGTRDYAAMARYRDLYTFTVIQIRSGQFAGRDLFHSMGLPDEADSMLQFLIQYYNKDKDLPSRLYLNQELGTDLFDKYLLSEKNAKLIMLVPQKGRHRAILNMALENAQQDIAERKRALTQKDTLKELAEALSLKKSPKRIEGFDIAQLSGKYPVASLVVFINGRSEKKSYRYFRLKSLMGAVDDYESLREAVARRYTRVLNEQKPLPDLVLVDGGRGQVSAVKEILDTLQLGSVPVVGLAKKEEKIYFPDRSEPLSLLRDSSALKLLQAVRDETHRFATSLNQKLRTTELAFTKLEAIEGIGKKRSEKLMKAFGSTQAIISAEPKAVAQAAGVSVEKAGELIEMLSGAEYFYH